MNNWKPTSSDKWLHAANIKRIQEWLNLSYTDLVHESASMLAIGSVGETLDEYGDLLERWIRKRLRTWSGGDISEFIVINPNLMTGKWRTDYYLQDIFRVICSDRSVHSHLTEMREDPPIEQIAQICAFLAEHPRLEASYYANKQAWGPVATLIYRMGLDNVLGCNDRK